MMIKINAPQMAVSRRSAVLCRAETARVSSRRPILVSLGSVLPAIVAFPSIAMILEEDDEEMVEKAKANRKARLEADRAITRDFLESEGIKDKQLAFEVAPLQTAIYKLAKSGAQLQDGDTKSVANSLGEPWVIDFVKASRGVGGDSETVLSKVDALKASAAKGDLPASKVAYVDLVATLKTWTVTNGISSKLVGL
eukprot:gene23518-9041_t